MSFHSRYPQWSLALLGPLILSIFSTLAQSSAAVNVALKTSFDAAPYLIELLYVHMYTQPSIRTH